MEFKRISKSLEWQRHDEQGWENFLNEFNPVGYNSYSLPNVKASYFVRLLEKGSSQVARGYGSRWDPEDMSNEMSAFNACLFDHGAFFKRKDGVVIATGMPYSDKELTNETFKRLKEQFNIPDSIKMAYVDDMYKYRSNGDFMVIFYSDKAFDAAAHGLTPVE